MPSEIPGSPQVSPRSVNGVQVSYRFGQTCGRPVRDLQVSLNENWLVPGLAGAWRRTIEFGPRTKVCWFYIHKASSYMIFSFGTQILPALHQFKECYSKPGGDLGETWTKPDQFCYWLNYWVTTRPSEIKGENNKITWVLHNPIV